MKRFNIVMLWILAVLPMVYTAIAVLFFLPDTVPAHFNFQGQVDRYGSKYEAFLLPGILLSMCLIYFVCRKIGRAASTDDPARTEANLAITDTVILMICVLFNALSVTILMLMANRSLFKADSIFSVVMAAVIGIVLILLGNIMPKTKRNHFLGMRLSFAMDTDEHWYIANRAGGVALVLSGFATIVCGLVFRNINYILGMVISLLVFETVAIIYSYVTIKGKKNKN